ncbi:hypothetical protein [Pseudozobellia thermophila]|uniref:Uncharacterized protein n=1 Tax=Pseudozobellia thermophila TaxID=192903 RepID=A0A1M6HZL3_9FLAO|nr:hypothetical protein [Pseudozobellia thermophila]SHJ27666.1 hypothetical protein SAMN04488513_103259 [Pseudozobellia thermophila]
MKAIVTLVFVIFFGVVAQANDQVETKVDTIEMEVVPVIDSAFSGSTVEVVAVGPSKSIVRLYRSKYSRVKKALSFSTKYSRSKLA